MSDDIKTKGVTDEQIADLREQEAEELAQVLATRYKIPYIDLSRTLINTDALRLLKEEDARKASVAIFKISGKNLSLALSSPNRNETQAVIEDFQNKNFKVSTYLASSAGLESAWEKYQEVSKSEKSRAGLIEISSDSIAEYTGKFKTDRKSVV